MTRKHFQMIADVLKEIPGPWRVSAVNKLVELLRKENPRFDETKFRKACAALPEARA